MDLSDHKKFRYLDYKLNNDPHLMKKYPRRQYPRLVDYLVQRHYSNLSADQQKKVKKRLYHTLWRQGLFHSCQA